MGRIPKRDKNRKMSSTEYGYYIKGFNEGLNEALPGTAKMVYAAAILTLKDIYDADTEQCADFITRPDNFLSEQIDTYEAADRVFNETGLKIKFGDSFEPVEIFGGN